MSQPHYMTQVSGERRLISGESLETIRKRGSREGYRPEVGVGVGKAGNLVHPTRSSAQFDPVESHGPLPARAPLLAILL